MASNARNYNTLPQHGSQEGITGNHSQLVDTCCGKRRVWSVISKLEKCFLVIALMTALLMAGFSSHRIYVLNQDHKPYSSEVVMLLSEGFCLYYISNAIFFERFNDIYIYLFAILMDVIYCSVDFASSGVQTPYAVARLVLDWILGFSIPCVLGAILTKKYNFPRIIQQQAGGLESEQNHFKRLLLFDSLLVFDLQLAACSVVLVVTDRQVDTEEIVALVAGQIVNLVFFALGKWASLRMQKRHSYRCGTFLFITLGSFPFLFFLYKAVKQRNGIGNRVYLDVASLIFSLLSIIIRIVILALCYTVSG